MTVRRWLVLCLILLILLVTWAVLITRRPDTKGPFTCTAPSAIQC